MNYFVQVNSGGLITATYAGTEILGSPWIAISAEQNATIGPGSTWSGTAVVAPAVPAPTLAQQASTLLAAGLTVTSTATSSLNATYAADPATISYVNSELNSILLNGTFADGTSEVQWPDASGALHTFSVAQFKTFAAALGAFVSGVRQCVIGVSEAALPSAAATIP